MFQRIDSPTRLTSGMSAQDTLEHGAAYDWIEKDAACQDIRGYLGCFGFSHVETPLNDVAESHNVTRYISGARTTDLRSKMRPRRPNHPTEHIQSNVATDARESAMFNAPCMFSEDDTYAQNTSPSFVMSLNLTMRFFATAFKASASDKLWTEPLRLCSSLAV